MPNAWGGLDPVEQADAADYELGNEYLANADITITHIRVWAGAGEINLTGRKGRIWSTAGGLLGIATLSDDLPTGWSSYALDTPVVRLAGQRFVVSYSTGGNYGALVNALDTAVDSSDGHVTAVSGATGIHGNGAFSTVPAQFPDQGSGNHAFYGCDATYTLGVGGNTAPTITQATVTAVGAVATATIVATDAETLVGAVYRYDWGDGTSVTSSSAATAQHTYSTSGTYGLLLWVTDDGGLTAFVARAVQIDVPSTGVHRLNAVTLLAQVVSHAQQLGIFEQVNQHEAVNAPGSGLTANVWVEAIDPLQTSGLDITSARLTFTMRIDAAMAQQPLDGIEPTMVAAVDALITAYSNDFTLGGTVRHVDLLGQYGTSLSARGGYLSQDGRLTRVMVITLPLILNDVWEQVE